MREIKFRAWDKERKKMLYQLTQLKMRVINNNLVLMSDFIGNSTEYIVDNIKLWRSFELMQFTGLKDKNGKEIYEGDIVEFNYIQSNKSLGMFEKIKSVGKVEYIDWLGAYCILFEEDSYVQIKLGKVNFEVIGNIYENPELLEEK